MWNHFLLQANIQKFIATHYKDDVAEISLKNSPFPEVSVQELAIQLEGKNRAEKKLPTWFNSNKILYPKKLNLSQTSSETTAAYKSSLISGKTLVDLTGGFGIDSLFFSKKIQHVVHCELDLELSYLAEHNFPALSNENNLSFFQGNGIEFLQKSNQVFDWIYVDPSRRSKTGNKVFKLEDCEPNIIQYLPLFFEKSKNVLVKTSPLLDINLGILSLKNVIEIHVVAVSNEVKELLWILSPNAPKKEIYIHTINFSHGKKVLFSENLSKNKQAKSSYSTPKNYLYEPNSAILKAGLFHTLSVRFEIEKLHPNSHLYTSKEWVDFPGRIFQIQRKLYFKPKLLKRELKLEQANISTRNFPKSADQLRKQLKLKDGGDYYLFFTTDLDGKKIVLVCTKITRKDFL